MVESLGNREIDEFEAFGWELENLKNEFLEIKKENFRASPKLKDEIKRLWFYNWDENWEIINFNVDNVRKHLESIKNKSWSELDVKSSELEKWVRTIAIQIAINYINSWKTNNIDLIDGIRWNQTWKGVKEFQTTHWLKNKDWLPWHETITKILELLPTNEWVSYHDEDYIDQNSWENSTETRDEGLWEKLQWIDNYTENSDFSESLLNYTDVDNNKCLTILKKLKINGIKNEWRGRRNRRRENFEKKLENTFYNDWGLEWIILKNPEIIKLLSAIVNHQAKKIGDMKHRYARKAPLEKWNPTEKIDENSDETYKEGQTWEEYKFENFSVDSFEDFILSEEWIAIIIDEIKSHIDTSHENENGEYYKFKENSPFSLANLEVNLQNAWEDKMHLDYYKKMRPDDLEGLVKMHVMCNKITWYVNKLVWDYREFNKDSITSLEWLVKNWIYGAGLIEMISGKGDDELKDIFKSVLSDKIKYYENLVRNENDEFILNTEDKLADLKLKSYLYLYWRIFYSEHFKANKEPKYYEDILPEIMKVIISNDDKSLLNKIKHKEFLETEKKLEEQRKKRDLKRVREAAKRNRARNESLKSASNRPDRVVELHKTSSNPNNATWPEIAAEVWLQKELKDYSLKIEESKEIKLERKEKAFSDAYIEFIKNNGVINEIITQWKMRELFDIMNVTIREWDENEQWRIWWDYFKQTNPALNNKTPEEIEKIHAIIWKFPDYFRRAEKKLSTHSSETKERINETARIYAMWSVIDNIRDTFNLIPKWENPNLEWFKLNENTPIWVEKTIDKTSGIIIYWTFNGTEVKIRYDLETGDLFMNSFLKKLSTKIRIWATSIPDQRIWHIKPFNDVLNDYYKPSSGTEKNMGILDWTQVYRWHWVPPMHRHTQNNNEHEDDLHVHEARHPIPTSGPLWSYIPKMDKKNTDSRMQEIENLLGSQLSLIGEAIKDNTESQTQRNSAITKFLKTFNIMSSELNPNDLPKNLYFDKESNLYSMIEILNDTWDIKNGDIEALEYFNNEFMPKIMEYLWLLRWKNNDNQNTENEKSKMLFNYEGNNEDIICLINNVKNFNPERVPKGTSDFKSSHQLWFVEFIKKVIATEKGPNCLILSHENMIRFIKSLEAMEKDQKNENNDTKALDKELDNQLASL